MAIPLAVFPGPHRVVVALPDEADTVPDVGDGAPPHTPDATLTDGNDTGASDTGGASATETELKVDAAMLVPGCEVLAQEGLRLWSVAEPDTLVGLREVFGKRAMIGVHNVRDAETAERAVAAGADFLGSPFTDPFTDPMPDLGVPVVLGGLTPNELRRASGPESNCVQLIPAAAFSVEYAFALPRLLAPTPLIASGELDLDLALAWLDGGAAAVWLAGVLDDALLAPELDELRFQARTWRHRTAFSD
jgi:2-dehydro-3-deoxyphosphogluconate aldolase/(4S)-4-hydroxy-2-oxoglutarate aldolase